MAEFFNLGEYAGYIWLAWGFAVVLLGGLIGVSLRSMHARESELRSMEAKSSQRLERGVSGRQTE
ncbi:MAG: heme exporter protein CcmD [Pseudomonadota bacterium]|nr:heme exporter protein CcmD [Pseudomonadota bacterium]